VAKFLEGRERQIVEALGGAPGDLLLMVADTPTVAGTVLGRLRVDLARRFDLIPADRDVFAWIIDFPLVEWNADEKRWDAVHHPFTAPRDEDLPLLESDPGRARAKAYDLVLNGQEAAGGSIRIHQPSVQERVFGLIGISKEDARARFGFLLDALEFGAPPMGGIAFGLDRLAANLAGQESIREVIAFPKTQKGTCPLTDAPAPVDARQLRDLGIRLVEGPRPA
jgi:aspartyl-tRNA synthetase